MPHGVKVQVLSSAPRIEIFHYKENHPGVRVIFNDCLTNLSGVSIKPSLLMSSLFSDYGVDQFRLC